MTLGTGVVGSLNRLIDGAAGRGGIADRETRGMQEVWPYITALWFTVALLAGGFARTRGRSAWVWFLLTLFTGPIAAFLLVVWPSVEARSPR